MWCVYIGIENVAQFETREQAERHAENLNAGYRTNDYYVKYDETEG